MSTWFYLRWVKKKNKGIFKLGLNREGKRNEGRNLNVYNGFKTQKVES